MDPFALDKKLHSALCQRNAAAALAGVLLVCTTVLSVVVLNKHEKTVLVPAGFQKEMEISNNEISSSYLEEMTSFYATMLLDVTPQTVDYQFRHILKHTAPESYHVIEKYLKEETEKYRTYNLSTSFVIEEVEMAEPLTALVTGKLTSKFIETGVFDKEVTYKISYKNVRGRLLIKEFNLVRS